MNFNLSEEQKMFVTSVERFAAPIDVEARRKLRLSPTGYDRARWQELAEMGLIALAAGEASGGMGGSAVDLALVLEAIGKANAPDPLLEHGILPALLLERGGAGEALKGVLSAFVVYLVAYSEVMALASQASGRVGSLPAGSPASMRSCHTWCSRRNRLASMASAIVWLDGQASTRAKM
jgi:alkylation response protein AidB-like acyl-CoA dehydrogenase